MTPVNRFAFGLGFLATAFVSPLAFGLMVPLKVMIVLSAVPISIALIGFSTRAGWFDRGHRALVNAVYGLGAGLGYWGLRHMAEELQEVTYYLTDGSPQGLGMAQYVAPKAGAVVPLFYTDLWVFFAAVTVALLLEAAYKARSEAAAELPVPSR